jgi:hypothetical protein
MDTNYKPTHPDYEAVGVTTLYCELWRQAILKLAGDHTDEREFRRDLIWARLVGEHHPAKALQLFAVLATHTKSEAISTVAGTTFAEALESFAAVAFADLLALAARYPGMEIGQTMERFGKDLQAAQAAEDPERN